MGQKVENQLTLIISWKLQMLSKKDWIWFKKIQLYWNHSDQQKIEKQVYFKESISLGMMQENLLN